MRYCLIVASLFICFSSAEEKLNLDTLNNYSEFLNFGVKTLKLNKESLENDIIKSKVDVLGDIFKKHIDSFKNSEKLEIVFLIDGSSSVGAENFQSELKFVKKLLSDVTVDFNHTRVAIVTYSSTVTTNIDQITQPRKENNKCFLLNNLLTNIEYTGGDTFTAEAFKTATTIFKHSRKNSTKVLFLITDGFSNGGDPIPVANDLKNNQVIIFTVGIQNGNYQELYELASSPGQFYSYLLDSFQEFENLARRALHVDLKSGEYIPLGINSPCAGLCEDGDCCDKNALCSCGTTTGHYSCVCKPGFYGTGLRNACILCPPGHYSDGPHLCRPCPDMHHTTTAPALSIESCTCKTGYLATKGNRCKTLKCPKMSIPNHGYFVSKRDCGNVLYSACGIRCEVGYSLVGNSIRLCQDNATWSGDQPSCQVKTCKKLPPPANGSLSCTHSDLGLTYTESEENLPVDTVCTFSCKDGKVLTGSSQRTCLPLARWDGLKSSCKEIKCPKYPAIKNGKIKPESCASAKQAYGTKCKIACDHGFVLEGPAVKTCQHGQWDSPYESTTCIDVEPPQITCPENKTLNNKAGTKFGIVPWDKPQVTDNVDVNVTVLSKPSNIDKEFKFPIGTTKVTYFAQDDFRNRAKCSFFVTVIDEEPPIIEDCVDPPTYLTNEREGANITWDEPNIFDNSDNVIITRSHEFGFFPIGTTSVTYTARDLSGNEKLCVMNITIEEAHCEALLDPIYGNSECSDYNDGMQCIITCQEGYAVPLVQPPNSLLDSTISFMCNHSESVWYNQEGLIFPECSVTEVPKEIEQNGTIRVLSNLESCNETEKIDDLENDIRLTLQEIACEDNCTVNTNTTCIEDDNEEVTNLIKRDVAFEEVPHRNTSRRRSKKRRLNVKFQVKGKYINSTQNESITIGSHNVSIHYHKPKFICPVGFVPRKNRCVQCPKGTFHNATRNRCQSCPFGSYNGQLGQTECTTCPKNYSTRKLHSKKFEDCIEQCPPGTYARRKIIKLARRNQTVTRPTLQPHCRSCPIGFYQPQYGQMRCIPCPKDYITESSRSISRNQCLPTAKIACSSGKNPCWCFNQCVAENEFQFSCPCEDKNVGPSGKPLVCDSNPCLNGGSCLGLDNSLCNCPDGFSGKFCQETKDQEKCLLNCLNNGTCHFNEPDDYFCLCPSGFGGEACEIKFNYCITNICENNGVCLSEPSGFRCECKNGYIGKRCTLLPCDYQPCKGSGICVNSLEENATRSSYSCVCPEGYTGKLCDEKIDFCRSAPCTNGGTCTSNTTSFFCSCPQFFYGRNCEFRRKSEYVLHFEKFSTTDYVKLDGFYHNLTQITACLWVQTKDNFNYGTLLSYATQHYDNAFALTDYTGLVLYINNHHVVTDVPINDGLWHHVCVIWNSSKGLYTVYLDAKIQKSGDGLAANTEIKGAGNMIIGQDQDSLGGHFSQAETFVGKIAYVDVWSKELTPDQIFLHMGDCDNSIFGDVYAWPDMSNFVQGNVKIENSSFCRKCEEPMPLYNGIINVIDNVAYYECYKGFYLSSVQFINGRKCTKAGKWDGRNEPFCKRVYCGYPGFVRNGYTIGAKYFFQDKIGYRCHEGYNMIGKSTITCTENGTWTPEKPACVGLQCKAFKKPPNSKLTILADHSYENFVENESSFDIGTQIEIECDGKAELMGENVITCQENGTWDFEPAQCVLERTTSTTARTEKKLGCDAAKVPAAPDNGYIVNDTSHELDIDGATIEYKCRQGHRLHGESSTTCVDGSWTELNMTCIPVECVPPPAFKDMVLKSEISKVEKYFSGNIAIFDCIEGYHRFGNGTIRCTDTGRWSRMKAKCLKRSCRKPSVKPQTEIVGKSYLFKDNVTLICPNKGQYVLTCNSAGMWIGKKDTSC